MGTLSLCASVIRPAHLFLIILAGSLLPTSTKAQDSTAAIPPRLLLEVPLLDLPYQEQAARMAASRRTGNPTPTVRDYLGAQESPSMAQALAITADLHGTNYYFANKLWNKWIEPTTKRRRLLNRLAANAQAGAVDYLLAFQLMAFGPAWLHEEFHRSLLSVRGVPSVDETYYRFGGGIANASISHVSDEAMIQFKRDDQAGLVRSFAAGIEGQYALLRRMQQDNFFSNTRYPNVAMNILLTWQGVKYVGQFMQPDYDQSIDTMNYYGPRVMDRDFVGWDFTAWVYDLHRPNEPYEARGPHPFGPGIDRVIKRSMLSPAEETYLKRMARLQYLNFLSPEMVGMHRIKLNNGLAFSFAVRHLPTSFGHDLGGDLLIDHQGRHWLLGVHTYHNQSLSLPGIELARRALRPRKANARMSYDLRLMAWLQPREQLFHDQRSSPGGLLALRANRFLSSVLNMYVEAEGKTSGWVMANPYLGPGLAMRAGLALDIR